MDLKFIFSHILWIFAISLLIPSSSQTFFNFDISSLTNKFFPLKHENGNTNKLQIPLLKKFFPEKVTAVPINTYLEVSDNVNNKASSVPPFNTGLEMSENTNNKEDVPPPKKDPETSENEILDIDIRNSNKDLESQNNKEDTRPFHTGLEPSEAVPPLKKDPETSENEILDIDIRNSNKDLESQNNKEDTRPFHTGLEPSEVVPPPKKDPETSENEILDTDIRHSNKDLESQNNKANTTLFTTDLETFEKRLYSELERTNREKNIIFSPLFVQSSIAMTRMRAEGQTALEIDQVLGLSNATPEDLADSFHTLLTPYQNSSHLKIANKLYTMRGNSVKKSIKKCWEKKFFSAIGAIDFTQYNRAAHAINKWVESKTNHLVKKLVAPELLHNDTRLLLVNALHFKGEWVHEFPVRNTREMDFYLDETNTVKVQMMHVQEEFRYKINRNLNATILEIPYKDSDLSMLVIMPRSRTGLADLEEKLKTIKLSDLTQDLETELLYLDFPKFKVEFDVEFTKALENIGLRCLFSKNAELGNIFKPSSQLQVPKVVHKAVLEVDEKGTQFHYRGLGYQNKVLPYPILVNNPFVYYIKNSKNLIIFSGNVKKL